MTEDPFRKPRNPDWTLEGHRKPRDIGPTLLVIALVVVAVAAAVIFAAVKWAPGLPNPLAPPPSTVEATRLTADYIADEEAAARTYRARPLTVTGKVIFRGQFANEETIQLAGSDPLRPVFIAFIGDIPANYHAIEVGQRIAATCEHLDALVGTIGLHTCTLKVLPPQ